MNGSSDYVEIFAYTLKEQVVGDRDIKSASKEHISEHTG